ncbi:MAG: enoyl-[acyl-carrier-protein] reductase FabK [Clostridia bacterium]|nr:enoyl-[acyl-carrier-protein] reductase FabK [Clostridia bacterium]
MKTRLCDLLGIEYPILQGAMAWVSESGLASAVSNAGGLGVIAAGSAPVELVEEEIIKAFELTGKPFGVNIMLMSPEADKIVEAVCRLKVPVVTTGAGNPGKYMDSFKEAGVKVIPVVPSVALAVRMERLGAAAVIVEGYEAGGHIGEQTTLALVPQIADEINIPVIAAGGIADARGAAAVLMLGAEGIQIGTRFICTYECNVADEYKEAVLKAKDRETVVTGRFTGHPVRVLRNKLTREMKQLELDGAGVEEFERRATGALARAVRGDVENGSVMAGQIAGLVKEMKSCREVIEEIAAGTEIIIKKTGSSVFSI